MKRVSTRLLRYLLLFLMLIALVAAGRALVLRKQDQLSRAPVFGSRPTPVRVVEARRGNLVRTEPYIAMIEPNRRANVSARLTATVEEVLCDEGDWVTEGQVLLRLDDREILEEIAVVQARVAGAEAELAANRANEEALRESVVYWERDAARSETLVVNGGVARSAAEEAADKANVFRGQLGVATGTSDALQHQIDSLLKLKEQAETKHTYCELRSPYEGVVTHRLVDPGDLGVPSKTLIRVEDRSRLKLSFQVPQVDLPRVREGLEVEFRVGDGERRARLSLLFPGLDRALMTRAEVFLEGDDAAGLSCGAYVPLRLESNTLEGTILLPATCIVAVARERPRVFLVVDDQLEPREVEVLESSGDEVAVRGIEPGDRVVTSTFLGWARLSSGITVEVVE